MPFFTPINSYLSLVLPIYTLRLFLYLCVCVFAHVDTKERAVNMFTPWRKEFVRDIYIMILSSEIFKQKSSSANYKKKSDFDFHLIKLHSTKTKDLTLLWMLLEVQCWRLIFFSCYDNKNKNSCGAQHYSKR